MIWSEASPPLPEDDRTGIRLSTAAQRMVKIDPPRRDPKIDWWQQTQWDQPRLTYLALAVIMLVTNHPQLVHLDNPTTAHAVVAYAAADGTRIYVADPSHPGESRWLSFDPQANKFEPYRTGTTFESPPVEFERAFFLRKRDVIDWAALGGLRQRFLAGEVGDGCFPAYTISASYVDDASTLPPVPLVDGYQTAEEKLRLRFQPRGFQGKVVLYRESGAAFDAVESGGSTVLELEGEQTMVGFLIEDNSGSRPLWVDFGWMCIRRGECLAGADAVGAADEWNRPGA